MPTLTRLQRSIRFNLENGTAAELFTTQAPRVPRGNDLALLLGLFNRGAPLDLSNLSSLRLELVAGNLPASPRLFTKDILAGAITPTITKAAFAAGLAAHATVNLTADDLNPTIGTSGEKSYTLIVTGVTSAGTKFSYGSCAFIIYEDGADAGANPPPEVVPPTYLTTVQVNALIDAKLAAYGGGGSSGVGVDYAVTTLTGGNTGCLDAVPTAGLTLPLVKLLVLDGALRAYLLTATTQSADGIFLVRPTDYHASTNARQWGLIL